MIVSHRPIRCHTATKRGLTKMIRKCRRAELHAPMLDLTGLTANNYAKHSVAVFGKKDIYLMNARLSGFIRSIDASKMIHKKHVIRAVIQMHGLLVIFASFQTKVYDGDKLVWASEAIHSLEKTSSLDIFKEQVYFKNKDGYLVHIDFLPLIVSYNANLNLIHKPEVSLKSSQYYALSSETGELYRAEYTDGEKYDYSFKNICKKAIHRNETLAWDLVYESKLKVRLDHLAVTDNGLLIVVFKCKSEKEMMFEHKPSTDYSFTIFDKVGKLKSEITLPLTKQASYDTYQSPLSTLVLPSKPIFAVTLGSDTLDIIGMTSNNRLHHLNRLNQSSWESIKCVHQSNRCQSIVMLYRDSISIVTIIC